MGKYNLLFYIYHLSPMKKIFLSLFLSLFLWLFLFGWINNIEARSYRTKSTDISVKWYYRKNWTYVKPYYRTPANSTKLDNYSCIDYGICWWSTSTNSYSNISTPTYTVTSTPITTPKEKKSIFKKKPTSYYDDLWYLVSSDKSLIEEQCKEKKSIYVWVTSGALYSEKNCVCKTWYKFSTISGSCEITKTTISTTTTSYYKAKICKPETTTQKNWLCYCKTWYKLSKTWKACVK